VLLGKFNWTISRIHNAHNQKIAAENIYDTSRILIDLAHYQIKKLASCYVTRHMQRKFSALKSASNFTAAGLFLDEMIPDKKAIHKWRIEWSLRGWGPCRKLTLHRNTSRLARIKRGDDVFDRVAECYRKDIIAKKHRQQLTLPRVHALFQMRDSYRR